MTDFHAISKEPGLYAAAAAKSLQSCLTLCDPIDSKPTRLPRPWDSPGENTGLPFPSPMHGTLEKLEKRQRKTWSVTCSCLYQPPPRKEPPRRRTRRPGLPRVRVRASSSSSRGQGPPFASKPDAAAVCLSGLRLLSSVSRPGPSSQSTGSGPVPSNCKKEQKELSSVSVRGQRPQHQVQGLKSGLNMLSQGGMGQHCNTLICQVTVIQNKKKKQKTF